MYQARDQVVKRLGLKGQLTGGMMSGYGAMKNKLSAEEYFEQLKSGEITDPTITSQERSGFTITALLPNFLVDKVCDNYGVLMVRKAQ